MENEWALIGLLIGIVLISACVKQGEVVTEEEAPTQVKTASDCEKLTTEGQRDNCYKDVAVASNDPSACDRIQGELVKSFCYEDIAIALNDLSICDKIQGKQLYKDNCYHDMAIHSGDYSICEQIITESRKNSCLLTITMDTKNVALCDKVTVDNVWVTDEGDCRSVVTAVSAGDYGLCEQIESSVLRDKCCEKVATDTKDVSLCDDATNKEYCYRHMAVATGRSSICERIGSEIVKNSCYNQVALHTKNARLCEKITDPRTKDNCIFVIQEYLD